MSNEFLWIAMMFVNFGFIVLFFKLFGKTGLYAWIAISIVVANIQVLKTVQIFGLVSTLGNIVYATSFLATDILNEAFGKKAAQKGVAIGFAAIVATTVLMQFSLFFSPHKSDFAHLSLTLIFGFLPRVALASVLAFIASQLHDVWAYNLLRAKSKKIWIANNLSTMLSQLIDTLIFVTVAFWGVFDMGVLLQIFATTYLFKWIVAACDTPFIYLAKRI